MNPGFGSEVLLYLEELGPCTLTKAFFGAVVEMSFT